MREDNFALLWQGILRSSLWVQESKETRLVWIAMLAMKDSDGCVRASMVGLADAAKVSLEEAREAVAVLLSPDPESRSKVEDGRRIREVEGGWQIINHDLYRFSTAAKREFWRQQKAAQRARIANPDNSKDLIRIHEGHAKNLKKGLEEWKKKKSLKAIPNERLTA